MVILDTSIIIDHLRQPAGKATMLKTIAEKTSKENLAISVLTVQELYEGESTRDRKREDALLATITPLKMLPYTYEIAQAAGELARDLPRPIETADAAIAATAIVHGAPLVTLDKKSFACIPDLELSAEGG